MKWFKQGVHRIFFCFAPMAQIFKTFSLPFRESKSYRSDANGSNDHTYIFSPRRIFATVCCLKMTAVLNISSCYVSCANINLRPVSVRTKWQVSFKLPRNNKLPRFHRSYLAFLILKTLFFIIKWMMHQETLLEIFFQSAQSGSR